MDDIVKDLEESGIKISVDDVEKKSKPEAHLCSYRISVSVKDLEKALDPSIWPLRVRVREYIHYSNKPKQSGPHSGQNSRQGNSANNNHGRPLRQQSVNQDVFVNHNLQVPLSNRYAPLSTLMGNSAMVNQL